MSESTLETDFDKAVAAAEVFMAALSDTTAGREGVHSKIALAVNVLHNVAYRTDNTNPNAFMLGVGLGLATIFSGSNLSTGQARKAIGNMTGLVIRAMNSIGRGQRAARADQ